MKPPLTEDSTAKELHPAVDSFAPASSTLADGATFLPLDDFLHVEVLQRPSLRGAVRNFLLEHCTRGGGIFFIAGRGKLIAELASLSAQRVTFGEVVKHATGALRKSESKVIRELDGRELARVLCMPAVDAH